MLSDGADHYIVPYLISRSSVEFQAHLEREKYTAHEFLGEGSLDKFIKVCKKLANVQPTDELYENMIYYINMFKHQNAADMKAYIAKEKLAWERLQDATALMDLETDGTQRRKYRHQSSAFPNFETTTSTPLKAA